MWFLFVVAVSAIGVGYLILRLLLLVSPIISSVDRRWGFSWASRSSVWIEDNLSDAGLEPSSSESSRSQSGVGFRLNQAVEIASGAFGCLIVGLGAFIVTGGFLLVWAVLASITGATGSGEPGLDHYTERDGSDGGGVSGRPTYSPDSESGGCTTDSDCGGGPNGPFDDYRYEDYEYSDDDDYGCAGDCYDMDNDGRTWDDVDADGDGLYESNGNGNGWP